MNVRRDGRCDKLTKPKFTAVILNRKENSKFLSEIRNKNPNRRNIFLFAEKKFHGYFLSSQIHRQWQYSFPITLEDAEELDIVPYIIAPIPSL